ncbi:ferrous iron transport protein B [Ereboglobus sp. PH5-10]|uniref:ferrous iron transport protein B n=1 Tax=Ereboglobus sp. PH5-10 TaxID=2940629 RepID=UPI002405B1E6|nr:ferrous iron transport protein B [Ereboglobus sp. PH5-10]MDF9826586.1 ferrous iron transport protein B [Ereboglobus sp. PH5-10]
MSDACPPSSCSTCPSAPREGLERLGVRIDQWDCVIALAGNPNTGKSTVFNSLTGLRQHTGNWPGKTIARAEGGFSYQGKRYKIVDLPGTYSLRSASPDETVAREFILFGQPDVSVIVVDASSLERNLNLVLQVLQITDKAVLCLNLMDEARANNLVIDARRLSADLGIPVVPCAARRGEGIDKLLAEIHAVATGAVVCKPRRLQLDVPGLREALPLIVERLKKTFPALAHPDWIALRLLEGDRSIADLVRSGRIGTLAGDHAATANAGSESAANSPAADNPEGVSIVETALHMRWKLPSNYRDRLTEAIYAESSRIVSRSVARKGASRRVDLQNKLDALLTGPWTGFPIMGLAFAVVLWITISGANVPSELLNDLLLGKIYPVLHDQAHAHLWPWLAGLMIDGVYLAAAWVISVMLPPMAIFFPLFTILEDFGYLPRVAFNLDRLFQRVGAHGKQSLTMAMGYGCNAAGIIAARVIDSPRERLIAIITNNFAICNGRWPTQILIATIFLGALAPAALAGVTATLAVFMIAVLGFALTLLTSWALSRTVLRGEASTFSLELPPYRPPNILRTLYTSLIDRTLFVLWRAIVFAAPAGAVIWLVANVTIGGTSLAGWIVGGLDPLAWFIGLNGVILLAYIIAIPANEIVIPTVLMLTVLLTGHAVPGSEAGVMFETDNASVKTLLTQGGWTLLTGINLMLFSLCHNPCSTTIYTIYKETRSAKWTALATFMPIAIGVALCSLVAFAWRMAAG